MKTKLGWKKFPNTVDFLPTEQKDEKIKTPPE